MIPCPASYGEAAWAALPECDQTYIVTLEAIEAALPTLDRRLVSVLDHVVGQRLVHAEDRVHSR